MTTKLLVLLFMAMPVAYILASVMAARIRSSRLHKDTRQVISILRDNLQGQSEVQIMRKTGLSSDRLSKTHYVLLRMGAGMTPEGKWVLRDAA